MTFLSVTTLFYYNILFPYVLIFAHVDVYVIILEYTSPIPMRSINDPGDARPYCNMKSAYPLAAANTLVAGHLLGQLIQKVYHIVFNIAQLAIIILCQLIIDYYKL